MFVDEKSQGIRILGSLVAIDRTTNGYRKQNIIR
jgi:hypothetical protein